MRRARADVPSYRFDERSGRYRSGTSGRYVAERTVRTALDTTLAESGKTATAISEKLRSGEIDVREWQRVMMAEIKNVHMESSALARGGWQQMSPAANGAAGREIRNQYAYLRGFVADIESGRQKLDGTLARRAQLYTEAGRATFHQLQRREKTARGYTEERNVRAASDSCSGERSCIGESARGWVPIGTLIPIGSRTCLSRCRCAIEHRMPEAAAA